jgi:hypothetical protein
MLRGVTENRMENIYTTLPKIKTKSSTTGEKSTSENQSGEIGGGRESACDPNHGDSCARSHWPTQSQGPEAEAFE